MDVCKAEPYREFSGGVEQIGANPCLCRLVFREVREAEVFRAQRHTGVVLENAQT
jgi:hypothetical protein